MLSFDMCILLGVRLDQSFLVRLLLLSVFLLFMGRSFFVTNFLFIFSFCMSLFGSFMPFHLVVSVGGEGMMRPRMVLRERLRIIVKLVDSRMSLKI